MVEHLQLLRRLEQIIEETEFAWSLCIIGEDQSDKLAELTGDLKRPYSADGDGKEILSGYSYWGIEPTIAWRHACQDPYYPVMKEGLASFNRGWRNIFGQLTDEKYHYVSLGPGTGEKDRTVLGDLHPRYNGMFYVPVDMSGEMLRVCMEPVRTLPFMRGFRSQVLPVQLDFNDEQNVKELDGLRQRLVGDEPVLFSLLGNTMANFDYDFDLLAMLSERLLHPQDRLMLEVATTPDLSGTAATAAAQEYERSKAFREFVTSALHQSTDLSIDMNSVVFLGSVEQERSLLVKVIYQNRSGRDIVMTVPDRTEVTFADGDTIRLLITRKYARPALHAFLASAGLSIENEAYAAFSSRRQAHRFGMSLMLLSRGERPDGRASAAQQVFRTRRPRESGPT
ncbi:L-histidine N(alpha)-methyltransferase [Micromonospora rifamycinica]|uniref:L-histidine N(alpha)-methyltransferase n=1 Tax=Micromonospora rifamycinica TaxID=291594 RepID=UPI0034484554